MVQQTEFINPQIGLWILKTKSSKSTVPAGRRLSRILGTRILILCGFRLQSGTRFDSGGVRMVQGTQLVGWPVSGWDYSAMPLTHVGRTWSHCHLASFLHGYILKGRFVVFVDFRQLSKLTGRSIQAIPPECSVFRRVLTTYTCTCSKTPAYWADLIALPENWISVKKYLPNICVQNLVISRKYLTFLARGFFFLDFIEPLQL